MGEQHGNLDLLAMPLVSLAPELLTASVVAAMLSFFAVIIRRSLESG
jgi:hypothetical protein